LRSSTGRRVVVLNTSPARLPFTAFQSPRRTYDGVKDHNKKQKDRIELAVAALRKKESSSSLKEKTNEKGKKKRRRRERSSSEDEASPRNRDEQSRTMREGSDGEDPVGRWRLAERSYVVA